MILLVEGPMPCPWVGSGYRFPRSVSVQKTSLLILGGYGVPQMRRVAKDGAHVYHQLALLAAV